MRIQILILGFKGWRASSHEPGWPGWPRLRVVPHFSSGRVERAKHERAWKSPHARKGDTWLPGRISSLVPKEKRPKILGTSYGAKFGNKATWRNTKILTFGPIIASATLKAVSLQLNGILVMWKIQQAMQDDAIRTTRIHPAFIPVTYRKCSRWTQRTSYKGFR